MVKGSTHLSSLILKRYERLRLSAILPRRSPSAWDTISPTYSMMKSPGGGGGRGERGVGSGLGG